MTPLHRLHVTIDDEQLLARLRIVVDALGGNVLPLRAVVLALLSQAASELEDSAKSFAHPRATDEVT